MRKFTALCLTLMLALSIIGCGQNNDNIPSKELMVSYCQNQGEDYAAKQLQGYKSTQLADAWGEPDGHLSGFWGDIWETNNTYNLIVYYDSDGIAEHITVMNEDKENPQ